MIYNVTLFRNADAILHLAWEAVASESFAHEALETNWIHEDRLRSKKHLKEN